MSGWWIVPAQGRVTVDDASLTGIDCSSIPSDVYLVRWWGTYGEILRNHAEALPARETFIDLTPYIPQFNQWISAAQSNPPSPSPPITLGQAQKVKIDMVNALFNSKRQLPIQYTAAGGAYWWDASDGAMTNMSAATIPALTSASLDTSATDSVASQVNSAFDSLVTQINGQVNGYLADQINYALNTIDSQVNAGFHQTNSLSSHLDATVLGHITPGSPGSTNTINDRLQQSFLTGFGYVAIPGLGNTEIVHSNITLTDIASTYRAIHIAITPPAIGPPSTVGFTVPWVPLGGSGAVTLSLSEVSGIMNAISARWNQLLAIRNAMIAQINALTTIAAVIAYNIVSGWPAIPLPPGYHMVLPIGGAGGVTVSGGATVSGGIPDAPADGVTYGRLNNLWTPALALTNNVLDGGSF